MHVNLLQKDRTVRNVLIDHCRRRHLGHVPLELDNLIAHDPLVVRVVFGKRLHAFHTLLKACAIDEIDGEIGIGHKGALGIVSV